jgi:hypothetical protein
MERGRFGSTVSTWTGTVAALCGGFGTLNPTIILQPGMSAFGRCLAVIEGLFSGFLSGAIIGALFGLIAGTVSVIWAKGFIEAGPYETPAQKPFTERSSTIAFIIGIVIGGIAVISSPKLPILVKSDAACSASNADLESAATFAKNHLFQDAADRAGKVIGEAGDCADGNRSSYLGVAYFFRAGAEDRMRKDYKSDAAQAQANLEDCVKNDFGDVQKGCASLLVGAKRYVSQHYCTESYQHSSAADGMLEKNPQAALAESELAVTAAGQCTNAYAYAFRGIALMERNAARYLTGDKIITDFTESKTLLERCSSELTGASHDQEVLTNCKSGLDADRTWLAKVGTTP